MELQKDTEMSRPLQHQVHGKAFSAYQRLAVRSSAACSGLASTVVPGLVTASEGHARPLLVA